MKTRQIIAVGLLIIAAAILFWWFFAPIIRVPASVKISALKMAEQSGYLEVLFRSQGNKTSVLSKKKEIGRADIDKIIRSIPVYSKLLAKSVDPNNPVILAQLNETNNRFISALEEVAMDENLYAIVRPGRHPREGWGEWDAKYQKFQDVTTKIVIKMQGS